LEDNAAEKQRGGGFGRLNSGDKGFGKRRKERRPSISTCSRSANRVCQEGGDRNEIGRREGESVGSSERGRGELADALKGGPPS